MFPIEALQASQKARALSDRGECPGAAALFGVVAEPTLVVLRLGKAAFWDRPNAHSRTYSLSIATHTCALATAIHAQTSLQFAVPTFAVPTFAVVPRSCRSSCYLLTLDLVGGRRVHEWVAVVATAHRAQPRGRAKG